MKQTITYIKSDLYRYCGNVTTRDFIKNFIFNRSFIYSFWLRLAQSPNILARGPSKVMLKLKSWKYGIQIPPQTKIGHGLYIGHGMSLVINPTTIIGNNCNLSQFTTIGSNKNRAAVIGDNVYIGPNVCIVEDVRIGNNATIGAGSVVTRDIPEDATAAGTPAKPLNRNNPGRYIQYPWPIQQNPSTQSNS